MDAAARLSQRLEAELSVRLRADWLRAAVASLDASHRLLAKPPDAQLQLVFALFLEADLARAGAGGLPADLKDWHKRTLEGRFVVQCSEVINVAAPIRSRYKPAGKGRCLKLHLTDGLQSAFAMEHAFIPALDPLAPAGLKLAITDAEVRRGLLLLRPENVRVLGGKVARLEEARQRVLARWAQPARGCEAARPDLMRELAAAAWRPQQQEGGAAAQPQRGGGAAQQPVAAPGPSAAPPPQQRQQQQQLQPVAAPRQAPGPPAHRSTAPPERSCGQDAPPARAESASRGASSWPGRSSSTAQAARAWLPEAEQDWLCGTGLLTPAAEGEGARESQPPWQQAQLPAAGPPREASAPAPATRAGGGAGPGEAIVLSDSSDEEAQAPQLADDWPMAGSPPQPPADEWPGAYSPLRPLGPGSSPTDTPGRRGEGQAEEEPVLTLQELCARAAAAPAAAFPITECVEVRLVGLASKLQLREGGRFRYSMRLTVADGSTRCVVALDHALLQELLGAGPEEVLAEMRAGQQARQKRLAAALKGFEGLMQLRVASADTEFPTAINMSRNP